jgi:hypothetical protein
MTAGVTKASADAAADANRSTNCSRVSATADSRLARQDRQAEAAMKKRDHGRGGRQPAEDFS